MNSSPAKSIKQVDSFLKLENTNFEIKNKVNAYKFIRDTIKYTKYLRLSKKDKGSVLQYLSLITGYSKSHTKRLSLDASVGILLNPKTNKNRTSFQQKYLDEDIKLLAKFDNLANYPNGVSLQESFRRMFEEFNDERFKQLSNISLGHIYNLRKTTTYRKVTTKYKHTKPVSKNEIGIREKPRSDNRPGFIRVDSVHGGDKDGIKGVYYVNFVDEITQFEIVVCIKGITVSKNSKVSTIIVVDVCTHA